MGTRQKTAVAVVFVEGKRPTPADKDPEVVEVESAAAVKAAEKEPAGIAAVVVNIVVQMHGAADIGPAAENAVGDAMQSQKPQVLP